MKRLIGWCLAFALLWGLAACGGAAPGAWQEQYDLGLRYLSEGRYEEAVLAFTEAIKIDPRRTEAYQKAVEGYEALGDLDGARALLAEALERQEDEALRQLYLRLCRTNDPFYDQLPAAQRELLADLAAAVLAEDWSAALDIQAGEACRALVNALPENQEERRLSLCFYPDDETRIVLFRGLEEGEADSHLDVFQGADGEGRFIASVYSPDHYYMNLVPFTGGSANGALTSYNRRWREEGIQDYTVTGAIRDGAPEGQVLYTYSDGRTLLEDGAGFTSWPSWPEELAR